MKKTKSFDRTSRRQFERENAKILAEFAIVINNFEDALFAYNWDASEELKSFPIFEKFEKVWFDFCDRWNKDKSHVAFALENAFFEYAINQNVKFDTTTTTDRKHDDRKTVSNEKKQTGINGRSEGQEGQVRTEKEFVN